MVEFFQNSQYISGDQRMVKIEPKVVCQGYFHQLC